MQQELLYQLHDIQLPDPVGWWPLAFSWWILIFSVTSILVGMLWFYLEQKKRNAYRLTALQKRQEILNSEFIDQIDKVAALNALLKQVAITAYGRNQTAALQNQEWVNFLADSCNYVEAPGDLLSSIEVGYKNKHKLPALEKIQALDTLADFSLKWIKGHHQ